MPLQIFNTDTIDNGTQAALGTTDDLYVKEGVLLASKNGFTTVVAFGSGQTLHIDGQVISDSYAIRQGDTATNGNNLYLGEASIIRSFSSAAITFYSGGNLELNGKVFADLYGLQLLGSGADETFVTNTGTIVGNSIGLVHISSNYINLDNSGVIAGIDGVYNGGSAGMTIINSGIIKGSDHGIENVGTGALNITNSGLIRLGALLGDQSDTYDGRLGRITGDLQAGGGNDTIKGGTSNERFEGDAGRDLISGGLGADFFIFVDTGDSTFARAGRDLISDFSHKSHDIIDVSSIDALASTGGDDSFTFVGTSAFSSAGAEIRYQFIGGTTFVYFNTDADKTAEMTIELSGRIHLVANDFAV